MLHRRNAGSTSKSARSTAIGPALAKGVLVLFFITLALVNTSDIAWPAVSWPMFSQRTPEYPGDTYEIDLFRAVDTSGQGIWVRSSDLWGQDRYQVGKKMIAKTLDISDSNCKLHRNAALQLIRFVYPQHETERVEIWHLTWDVDLGAMPALIFDAPRESSLLASFTEEALLPNRPGDSQ